MPKGVYKHKKENTNTNAIQEINNAYSKELSGYKARAAAYRNNRKYTPVEITRATYNILDYIKSSINAGKPATIAGIILASGFSKRFYYTAKQGDLDYIQQEYIELNNIDISECETDPDGILFYIDNENNKIVLSPISEIIEKCLLLIENDLQIRTLTDKSMARTTGAIFNLKAVFNYNDKPETETKTVNNTLIVNANPEQTAKAMQLLLDNK
jgi:hypothetical protein